MMMLQIRGMRKLMAPLELLDSMNGAIVKNPKWAKIRKISAKISAFLAIILNIAAALNGLAG